VSSGGGDFPFTVDGRLVGDEGEVIAAPEYDVHGITTTETD